MTKFLLAATAVTMMLAPVLAAVMPSAEQCTAWFEKIDVNTDGSLGKNEDAVKLSDAITKSSSGSSMGEDGIVTKELFMTECQKGTFGMPSM